MNSVRDLSNLRRSLDGDNTVLTTKKQLKPTVKPPTRTNSLLHPHGASARVHVRARYAYTRYQSNKDTNLSLRDESDESDHQVPKQAATQSCIHGTSDSKREL